MLGKFKLPFSIQSFDLLLLVSLLSVAFDVSADPISIGVLTISWMTVAQVVVIAYSVYGAAQQRKAAKASAAKARADYNAGLQDRTATLVSTESPHRIIYGEARVGSTVVAMFTSGSKDQYKHLVCVHAAHECESIGDIHIAGKLVGDIDSQGFPTGGPYYPTYSNLKEYPFSGTTYTVPSSALSGYIGLATAVILNKQKLMVLFDKQLVNGTLTTIKVDPSLYSITGNTVTTTYNSTNFSLSVVYVDSAPTVNIQKHLGGMDDPADSSLIAALPGQWGAAATLRGFCYTVVRLDLNQPEFQSGLPTIEAVIKGKKLYDPRDGITRWSENPALATYDYLTSDICGVPASDLPLSQYITAANVCDEIISVGKRYTINGTVTSDQNQSQVLEAMAQCMVGSIVSTTWDIYAGKYIAPVMALNQTDIVGSIAITPGISDADLYNGVKGQYIGAENLWVSTDYKPYQNPTYAAVDGRDLWNSVDMSFTNTVQRVHNLCRIFVEDQRNGFTIKADFSLKAWGLKVGQRVTFTSAFFGQTAKVYRITDKKFSPSSAIELTLKEDSASIWDEADAVVIDATLNTNLVNPFDIEAIASLTCASGADALFLQSDGTVVSRILATWPTATTQIVVDSGVLEIQWQAIGSDVWQTQQVSGANTQAYIAGVVDGDYYNVRIRAVNPTLNVKSDWEYSSIHQVIGKTEPPADVPWFSLEGNILTWGKVGDIDLAGYVIRFHYGHNTSWGDAAPLHTGVLTQSPYTPETLPQGPVTLMIRAVDSSGNLSHVAAVIQTQFGDVLVANVVETFDFKALSYSGVYAGATLTGGSLLANSTSNFYKDDLADFYTVAETLTFYNDYFSALVYETIPFTVSTQGVGGNLTLNVGIVGEAPTVQYRVSGANPMYNTVEAEAFFQLDTDNFYGADPDYQTWPGQIVADNLQYQFKFTIGQGVTQGVMDMCNVVVDVPDRLERLSGFTISNVGTRLALTSPFYAVENIQLTLEADGGTATKVEIADKNNTLGPLIYCRNSAGTLVSGKVDAVIQGY